MVDLKNCKKDEVCKCRSCNRSFHQSEIKREQSTQIHSRIKRTCPYCGKEGFGLINYPVDEEILIYGDSRKNLRVSKKDSEYALMNKYGLYDEQELEFFMNGYIVR